MKKNELFKEETLAEKLIKKWFWVYLFSFLIAPAGYIIRVIISNDLSVSDVWILYSIISFISLISTYNDLWLTQSLRYFLPKYRINKQYDHFKTAIFFSLSIQILTWILIAILLFFGADFLAINYFHNENATIILKVFCVYFLWINLYQSMNTIYYSFQDVFYANIVEFIRMWSIVLFTIFFFFQDFYNIYFYAIAWIAWLFISIFIWSFMFYQKYKKEVFEIGKLKYNKNMLKEYTNYAFLIFLTINAGVLLWQIDQQMIVYMLWTESVWYYSNYLSLLQFVNIVITPILSFLLMPIATEFINKQKYIKIELLQNFFYKYFSIFSLSFGIFLMIMWEIIAVVLFGEKFIYSWHLLLFSGLFIIFNILANINYQILQWWWEVKYITKTIFFTVLFVIISNIFLINYFWIFWAIISTIIWWFLMYFFSFKKLNSIIKISFDWSYFLKNFILFMFIWILLYFIINNFLILKDQYRYINLFYLVLAGFIYYWIIWLFNYKELIILKWEILRLKNKNW